MTTWVSGLPGSLLPFHVSGVSLVWDFCGHPSPIPWNSSRSQSHANMLSPFILFQLHPLTSYSPNTSLILMSRLWPGTPVSLSLPHGILNWNILGEFYIRCKQYCCIMQIATMPDQISTHSPLVFCGHPLASFPHSCVGSRRDLSNLSCPWVLPPHPYHAPYVTSLILVTAF